MKFSSNKIIKLIKKNIEIILLFLLLAIIVATTTISSYIKDRKSVV